MANEWAEGDSLWCDECCNDTRQPHTGRCFLCEIRTLEEYKTFHLDRIEELEAENKEINLLFDSSWDATVRGANLWRDEAPDDRKLILPDQADHVKWLLGMIESLEATEK